MATNTKALRLYKRKLELERIAKLPNAQIMEEGDLVIAFYDNNLNKPCARIWLRTAAKPCLAYSFYTNDSREKHVAQWKANYAQSQEYRKKWQSERLEQGRKLKDGIKAGDILVSTGGATMHFVDYFRVVDRNGCKLTLMPLAKVFTSGCAGDGHCAPDQNYQSDKRIDAKIGNSGRVIVPGEYSARPWDGGTNYENHWD